LALNLLTNAWPRPDAPPVTTAVLINSFMLVSLAE